MATHTKGLMNIVSNTIRPVCAADGAQVSTKERKDGLCTYGP